MISIGLSFRAKGREWCVAARAPRTPLCRTHRHRNALLQGDSAVEWAKLECVGAAPSKRSGHSLTSLGGTSGLLFGGEFHSFSRACAYLSACASPCGVRSGARTTARRPGLEPDFSRPLPPVPGIDLKSPPGPNADLFSYDIGSLGAYSASARRRGHSGAGRPRSSTPCVTGRERARQSLPSCGLSRLVLPHCCCRDRMEQAGGVEWRRTCAALAPFRCRDLAHAARCVWRVL